MATKKVTDDPLLSVEKEWETTAPSSTVVRALAILEDTAPEAMEITLYEYVDPDALDALVADRTEIVVSFLVEKYVVAIDGPELTIRFSRQ